MDSKKRNSTKNGDTGSKKETARSASVFAGGIRADADYLAACWAVADDLANARFAPSVGNGIAMNMRNMLKMLDLKYKHGKPSGGKHTLAIDAQ